MRDHPVRIPDSCRYSILKTSLVDEMSTVAELLDTIEHELLVVQGMFDATVSI